MSEIEKFIIGAFLVNKSADPKVLGLRKSLFSSQDARLICEEILCGNRDEVVIFENLKTKSNSIASFLAECTDGLHRSATSEERIRELIKKRKIALLNERVLKLIAEGVKRGFDHSKIRGLYEQIASLDTSDNQPRLSKKNFLEIPMERVSWLWYPVAPFGMVGTILGNPGVGKTFVLADLAARVSAGKPLPIYRRPNEKIYRGGVIYITSEGVPEKILKPRLYAAGAVMENITLIQGLYCRGKFQVLDVRHHLNLLLDLIRKEKKTPFLLAIIDPIASFVSGSTNLNDAVQARHALDVIARFAEEAGVAVLAALHPNKDETKRTIARAAGSMQMSAAVKTAWVITEPKDDDPVNMRYFAPYKIQMAEFDKNETLPFYLENANFNLNGELFEVAKIKWSERLVTCNIERILSPRVDERVPPAIKVRLWLKEILQEGSQKAEDIYNLGAEQYGFSKTQIFRASKALNVERAPLGFSGGWIWTLPQELKD